MRAAEYSAVPILVAFLVWLHAHVAANYGLLIADIPGPDHDGVHADADRQDEGPALPASLSATGTMAPAARRDGGCGSSALLPLSRSYSGSSSAYKRPEGCGGRNGAHSYPAAVIR
jgi:hypothetical protein